MNKLMVLALVVLVSGCVSPSCNVPGEKYCTADSDCMCSTSPCFLGSREYFNACIVDKQSLGACPDMCGFGPYGIEFRYVCDNGQCAIATYNRTTGQELASIS
jgi:hypothetical protein